MTISQTVIMISIGTLLIQPVSGKNLWGTFAIAALLIVTLMILEFVQLKWNKAESFFTGKAKIVIENGQLDIKTLKKLKLSVDKLEMRLRQQGIASIQDLKWATVEPSGQLGYMLKENKQPATKEDVAALYQLMKGMQIGEQAESDLANEQPAASNLFSEIDGSHQPDHSQRLN
ncbi:DUF421 domain-containing protein [Terribacillus sp. DMT04]|uniref:DUF421 domain-containing protein n=1 Tax=Terribacillus sp. DMT04 TaxID=2850441 RepID=UPI001C2CB866|nr:YetF domain-containing protein [Terribacillus sp. DMT04]QXE02337.1 DUF421 domain-containing protein [Terribacillus sp. DMT04]